MESGLEDRNNLCMYGPDRRGDDGLNGVRPRRPEQSAAGVGLKESAASIVSMESGLEDRNNTSPSSDPHTRASPSQWSPA